MNRSLQTLGQKNEQNPQFWDKKMSRLGQKNEQNPQFWDKKMSRLGQKNEQSLFTTHCNTEVYEAKNRLEIISEILRNNLVILEIEKRAQKFWDFWSVSLSLRTGNTEIVVTNNNK